MSSVAEDSGTKEDNRPFTIVGIRYGGSGTIPVAEIAASVTKGNLANEERRLQCCGYHELRIRDPNGLYRTLEEIMSEVPS